MDERNELPILAIIVILSFAVHCIPAFVTPAIPLYDTDSWYTIRQIQLINTNQPLSFDPMLNPPDGKAIDWGTLTAKIYSLFSRSTDPIVIFYNVAWVSPLILSLGIIAIFFIVRDIFDSDTAILSAALIGFCSGALYQNGMWGMVDHHLFESLLGCIFLLCIVGTFHKKSWQYAALEVMVFALAIMNSPLALIYLVIGGIVIIAGILLYIDWKWVALVLFGAFLFTFTSIFGDLIQERIPLILSASSLGITELRGISSIHFLQIYNILLLIVIVGVLAFKDKRIAMLGIATIPLLILTIMFRRFDVLLAPILCITAAAIIMLRFRKYTVPILAIFIVFSLLFTSCIIAEVADTSHQNEHLAAELLNLREQPPGVVLSQWGYGFWILDIANKTPFSDPFQVHEAEASRLLSGSESMARYNISYVIANDGIISKIS
jgi:asparagine N-glycosylation enzyme membrane subunit Stt3